MSATTPAEKYEHEGMPALTRPDLIPPKGWSLKDISALETVRNHALSPDGKMVAFFWDRCDTSDLYVVSATGGWPRRLTIGRGPVIPWDDELPAWSPDSCRIAFSMDDHGYIVDVVGGLPHKLLDFDMAASSPVWMPDCRQVVVSVSRHEAVQMVMTDLQGDSLKWVTNDPGADSLDPRPSPDGRWIAWISRCFADLQRFDLYAIDLLTGKKHLLCGSPGLGNHTPRWRPDGSGLAFLSQASGFYEIWLVDPDGSNLHQLTRFQADVSDIAWSPTGETLAAVVNRQGFFELLLIDPISGETEKLLGAGHYSRPNWSPDGRFITYEFQSPHAPPDIFRLDMQTRQVMQLTFSMLPSLEPLDMIEPEAVSFKSTDGLTIAGFLYRPKKANRAGLLYLHGGPNDQYVPQWDIFLQYLVASGYTILCPNYRGSTGYGREFERLIDRDWGGREVQDCLMAADYLASVAGVDKDRLGLMGPSYGGYLTNCLLSADSERRFRCGVSIFGDADLLTSWAQCSLRLRRYTESYLGNPAENEPGYRQGSPIFRVEQVHAPLLLLHGLDDDIVPPQASEEWAQALHRAGKTYEYKTYDSEPHGFLRRSNRLDAWERIERFLNWYLMPIKTEGSGPKTEDR